MLKKFFIFIVVFLVPLFLDGGPVSVAIKTEAIQKMKLLIGVIKPTEHLIEIQKLLQKMFSQSKAQCRGFYVEMETYSTQPTKKTIKSYEKGNIGIALFLSCYEGKTIEWRLYETHEGNMLKGKRFSVEQYPVHTIAEYIADQVWPILTGQNGFFSTRIAYCKHVYDKKGIQKHICVTQPYQNIQNSHQETHVIVDKGNAFAPRWNNDTSNPLILYSEIGKANVRLMAVSLDKKKKLVANLEGMTTHASFSKDGKKVVYCSADGSLHGKSHIFLYEIDEKTEKPYIKQITHNNGNNISPILCSNGDIIFCSDAGSKMPYICRYISDTGLIERITQDGYACSPALCEVTQKIAYSKNVNGVMQLFIYDMSLKSHSQLTFDSSHKEQSSWSPCGNYLAFTQDTGKTLQIAIHHIISGERIFLTSEAERCSYPCWSPNYQKPMLI